MNKIYLTILEFGLLIFTDTGYYQESRATVETVENIIKQLHASR